MKKHYKILIIIGAIVVILLGAYFAIKAIMPIRPNVGFHFVPTEKTILEYIDDPDTAFDVHTVDWLLIDGRYVVCDMQNRIVKIDSEIGEVVARTAEPFPEEQYPRLVGSDKSGNIFVVITNIDKDGETRTYNLLKYSPSFELLHNVPVPEGFYLRRQGFSDGIFYTTTRSEEDLTVTLYTLDEKMNILNEETTSLPFVDNPTRLGFVEFIDANGNPAIYWDILTEATKSNGETEYNTEHFITSFEANPSFIAELPNLLPLRQYGLPGTGDGEYIYYMNFNSNFLILRTVYNIFGEDIIGDGILGIKADGTSEKIVLTNEENDDYTLAFNLLWNTNTHNGDIYFLSDDYIPETDPQLSRIVLEKLEKVYD